MAEYATTSSNSSNGVTWSIWVGSATSSETINGSAATWSAWVDITSSVTTANNSPTNGSINIQADNPPQETDEQRQARMERVRERQAELETARKEKEAAQKKAEVLLREILDQKQREQFDKTKWFYIIGQSGKRYRIRHGWIGNIDEVDEKDMAVAGYCIHPQVRVPVEDSMLIQKLMLEVDEQRFLQIANKTTYPEPRPLAV